MVGPEPAFQDEAAAVLESKTADLRRRRFRRTGKNLLQDLV